MAPRSPLPFETMNGSCRGEICWLVASSSTALAGTGILTL